MSTSKRSPAHAGIEVRHQTRCRTHTGGQRCNCNPSYRAVAYDARQARKLAETFHSLAQAKAWRSDASRAIRQGRLRASRPQTLREAAEAFIEGTESGAITNRQGRPYKRSTARSYSVAIRLRLLPAFGAHQLDSIRRRDLQLYVERLHREGVSASRIHNTINPLRAIYRRALDLGDVALSPCDGLRLPAEQGRRQRIAAPDEAARLIAALPEAQRAIWATAFYTGLRVGELQALDWSHVDLEKNLIRVERSWDREAGFIEVKSDAGERTVPVPGALRPFLAARKLATGGSGLVFATRYGNVFQPSNLRRDARRWWDKAGLASINPHECRHTYASLMIAAGVNAKALSTYMGHASISITLDRYGHLMPGNEAEAAELLDAYLARSVAAS
jgi:integrase